MSQTLIYKTPQAVTKLGVRCKDEYSSSQMYGTEGTRKTWSIWGYKKMTEDNHKILTLPWSKGLFGFQFLT